MNRKEKIQSLITLINTKHSKSFTNLTDAVKYVCEIGDTEVIAEWYAHYQGMISVNDGMYNGFNYNNCHVIGDYLYICYSSKPHHFTSGDAEFRCIKYKLSDGTRTETKIGDYGCVFHSVKVGNTYYFFANNTYNKVRLVTTDFVTFTETTFTGDKAPNYICVGQNNRLWATFETHSKESYLLYSDDLGLTWTTISTGTSNVVPTHGGIVNVNGTIVAYCQESFTDSADGTSARKAVVSADNGTTWTETSCTGDLADAGTSYVSGDFCQIGDTYYYFTSNRTCYTDDDDHYVWGKVLLFKGTAQQVINGTMELFKTIDEFDAGTKEMAAFPSTHMTDSGNVGITTDGTKVYCVYMKPLLHSDPLASNCMISMSIVDTSNTGSKSDSYFDSDWQTKRDAFVSAKDTDHDLYIYMDGTTCTTNLAKKPYTSDDFWRIASDNCLPQEDITVDFTSDFDLEMIYYGTRYLHDGSWINAKYGCGLNDTFYGMVSNRLMAPIDAASAGGGCNATSDSKKTHFKLSYHNRIMKGYLDGIEIPNILVKSYSNFDVPNNKIQLDFKDRFDYIISQTMPYDGLVAMTLDTDGDVTSYTSGNTGGGSGSDSSSYPTDGLLAYYDVGNESNWADGVCTAENGATYTNLSYDRNGAFHLAFADNDNKKTPTVFENNTCNDCFVVFDSSISSGTVYTLCNVAKNTSTVSGISSSAGMKGASWYKNSGAEKDTHFWVAVLTNDGVTKEYMDGELISNTVQVDNLFTNAGQYYFGNDSNGRIGDCFIYNKELSQAEITQLYTWIQTRHTIGS